MFETHNTVFCIMCKLKEMEQIIYLDRVRCQRLLPIHYFGVECDIEKYENKSLGDVQQNQCKQNDGIVKEMDVYGICESRKELGDIHSDVRSKAAMFDDEAYWNEHKLNEYQQVGV